MRRFLVFFALFCLIFVPTVGATPDAIQVKEVGSFYIGGGQVTLEGLPFREFVSSPGVPPVMVSPNGDFEVGQMYVQYVLLDQPRAKYPLLLWHGGGLTGSTWESTPDGRPGWQMFFLRNGHSVYVSDAVERGRASWARYPEIYPADPLFRGKGEAWELFRFGPQGSYNSEPLLRETYKNTQFPVKAFDQFMKEGVPRWSTNDAMTQAAYDKLVEKVGPCVLVAHSQGGNFAITAALHNPAKVKALILIEPTGGPDPTKMDLSALKNVPQLFVWGDNISEHPFWSKVQQNHRNYTDAIAKLGGTVTWIDLPKLGIAGNSHMLMMDKNSDEVAALVQKWLQDSGLMK